MSAPAAPRRGFFLPGLGLVVLFAMLGPAVGGAAFIPLAAFLKTNCRFNANSGARALCRVCSSRNSGLIWNSSARKSSRYGATSRMSSDTCFGASDSAFWRPATRRSYSTTSARRSSSKPFTVMRPGSPGPPPTRYTLPVIITK